MSHAKMDGKELKQPDKPLRMRSSTRHDRAKWDCDGLRDELYAYAQGTLATSDAVIVIDAHGLPQKRRPIGWWEAPIQWYGGADRELED